MIFLRVYKRSKNFDKRPNRRQTILRRSQDCGKAVKNGLSRCSLHRAVPAQKHPPSTAVARYLYSSTTASRGSSAETPHHHPPLRGPSTQTPRHHTASRGHSIVTSRHMSGGRDVRGQKSYIWMGGGRCPGGKSPTYGLWRGYK